MIYFNLDSFPSVVLLRKGEPLTKELFTEGEYQNLANFTTILSSVSEKPVDPLTIINVVFDSRGEVTTVYGPQVGLTDDNQLALYCNKVPYPFTFVKGKELLFADIKINPLIGREIVTTNKDDKQVKIVLCNVMISNYSIPISMNKENPFSINEQVFLMSAFLSGDFDSYEKVKSYFSVPSMGGNRIKPNQLAQGVYVITSSEEKDDKFGKAYNLTLKNLHTKEVIEVFSCSYFKSKFPIYRAGSLKSNTPLYLLVEEPKIVLGKPSFNGSFSLDPSNFINSMKADTNIGQPSASFGKDVDESLYDDIPY